MKRVLIAHQTTIPHYRVPFYNVLEQLRPRAWSFDVVFDPQELIAPRFFKEELNRADFHFPILETHTLQFPLFGKTLSYQTFWRQAGGYDLIIVENAVNNLTYPLCQLHQFRGTKFAYWGHEKDRKFIQPTGFKRLSEKLKLALVRRADGFFAYSHGVKAGLEGKNVPTAKIFVVNNTLDIEEQRCAWKRARPRRESIRQALGIEDKKVLLFVGRFSANKRMDFLLRAYARLRQTDPSFWLLLVGSGELNTTGIPGVSTLGPIVELDELAPIYVASDLFVIPGAVGLAPLQAFCYDLPAVAIESPQHGPEIEYLSAANSLVLPADTDAACYAQAIFDLFQTPARLDLLRTGVWPSIRHLTVEQMAENFIHGVNTILGDP